MPTSAARRSTSRRRPLPTLVAASIVAIALVAAGCGAAASPSPEPSPTSPDGSTEPAAGFRLRVTTVQALPPLEVFSWTPLILITDDLVAVQGGAILAIFPGPLVVPLVGTQLTEEAWAKLASEAEAGGLLDGNTDFTGGRLPPGAAAARLQLVVEGRTYDLTGDPDRAAFCGETLCRPEPGTPEAFATFLSLLGDLPGWLGAGVGAGEPWTPAGYAILVGPPPPDDQGLAVAPLPWPFATGAAEFGKALSADADRRCGLVEGDEATAFAAILRNATQLTTWQDPAFSDPVGLTVRPLLPGDGDPCAPLVGS